MTDFVSAVAGATVNPTASGLSSTYALGSEQPSNELDREAFLKLLVTQLKYQDPLNPSDPSDFIATTAQFTTIEELQKMAEQQAAAAVNSSLTTASAMVGRTIGIIDQSGNTISALVERAQVVSGEVRLATELGEFGLDEVVEISA